MFGVIKKIFVVTMTFLVSSVNSLECVSMNHQECKVRKEIISVNNNEPVFYPFSIKVNKCSGSCNNISNPYAKSCVSDVVKNINLKVFNLLPWSNQTKQIKWHESFKCECNLNSSVCNNKQRWNEGKCRCECKELVNKQECDKGFILCNIREYLDHKNCKCRKLVVDSLVEKCSENIDENEVVYNKTFNVLVGDHKCGSCTLYIVLFVAILVIGVIIGSAVIYCHWYLKKYPKVLLLV